MSNIINSSEKSLLEFLQDQTKDSFLQKNYPASNQRLLEFISEDIFLRNLTEDQEKKLLKLGELSIEKQGIDQEIAKIQNSFNKTDELSSKKIKLNYFNGLRDICSKVFDEGHGIFNEINEAKNNLIFANLFIKDKASQNPKKVFINEELNSKYILGINSFHNKIWEEISDSDKFKNLQKDEKFNLDKSLTKILSKLKSDSTSLKNQNKTNETAQPKTLEELEEKHSKIVQEINKINEELDPNIKKEEAEKILKEIFSGIKVIQDEYNKLTYEQKQKIKVCYRNYLYYGIEDEQFSEFIKNLKEKLFTIKQYKVLTMPFETQAPTSIDSLTDDLLFSFIKPLGFFKGTEDTTNFSNSIDFSNSNFREQLIFALKQVASFYGIEDYKDFKLNFDFIENDQINPAFRAYKLNKFRLHPDELDNITILIPQEYIENDDKFHELEKNLKIFEGFKPTESKIEIFKEFGYCNAYSNLYSLEKSLLSIQRKDLLEDFYNLPDEKLKIIAKFQTRYTALIIKLLKNSLLNTFFDLIKKSDNLSEIEKMTNHIQDKKGDTLWEYIENIVIPYVRDYKFENQSNQENNIEFKSASNISQEQQMEYQNNSSLNF